ncbi:MAG: glycoside hydrolase family 99-like domain-containing protein, partial [Desulfuromonadales bacterium]|nr:glycoside hydrolase family 99-like domain-containing protein [Desulfuromonadales bacterium]
HHLVAERDGQLENLHHLVAERDGQIIALKCKFKEVLNSKSWTLTAPLRNFRRVLTRAVKCSLWNQIITVVKKIWHSFPIPTQAKEKLKGILFTHAPFMFRHMVAYKNWIDHQSLVVDNAQNPLIPETVQSAEGYVPLLQATPLEDKPVKLICFYLPQFHPIPENDEWWGEGFTEWTNVQPAQPQFVGHYQPHIPGELGYYNLLEPLVQRRQVELAKLYGISGFCFYFYWFGGTRLLEAPIENYLHDRSLDLPFCLCWANENWSRRWDGLESDILISQKHSPEDDIEFIAHVTRYMKDDRYIRIDGKPLLLVYRPSLLPAARETVKRWRGWCLENEIGEIYLAYTQSFENMDPSTYGFDAAIEFPPNNSAPPNITNSVKRKADGDFLGEVYDWRVFVERSKNYNDPGYKLFRSVNPGWDNTARKKNKGNIFLNNTPQGYQEWLHNAIIDTQRRFVNADERVVFINAWNEWAEGAHLEPDQRNGYAYLEATRMAQVRTTHCMLPDSKSIAIIIHAFYEDVFIDIIKRLSGVHIPFKLFVTTPHDLYGRIEDVLSSSGFHYSLAPVENRGRDVLPFLKTFRKIVAEGYAYFLKIHTKKSFHREDGDYWRDDLYGKLLSNDAVQRAISIFNENNRVGLIGPSGHVVPMEFYFGSNAKTVERLARRLGQSLEMTISLNFVAGTMFFARTDALLPLLNLELSDSDFEPEAGQIDGTLAHALERVISVSNFAKSYILIDTDQKEPDALMEYQYAKRSV